MRPSESVHLVVVAVVSATVYLGILDLLLYYAIFYSLHRYLILYLFISVVTSYSSSLLTHRCHAVLGPTLGPVIGLRLDDVGVCQYDHGERRIYLGYSTLDTL